MRKILAVAQNTFREAIRNRIFASLIFFTLGLLGFTLAMSSASLHEEVRLMTDVGLFLTSTAAVFIAIFTGVNLVYKELERKTIYTLMAKPISRPQFLLGKYLGLLQTMFVLVSVMGVMLCGILATVGGNVGVAIMQAIWLIFIEVAIVVAVALIFSSFSTPFLSGLMTLGVFVVGRFVDALQNLRLGDADKPDAMTSLVSTVIRGIVRVVPDLSIYNVTPQVVYNRPMTVEFIAQASLVGFTYIVVCLGIASVLFSRRDFV
ncbi:MAG: ABC transporter permease [Myxococcota bacterium]|nr:ABC transporter permease [Myxococcota bacterium]